MLQKIGSVWQFLMLTGRLFRIAGACDDLSSYRFVLEKSLQIGRPQKDFEIHQRLRVGVCIEMSFHKQTAEQIERYNVDSILCWMRSAAGSQWSILKVDFMWFFPVIIVDDFSSSILNGVKTIWSAEEMLEG